MPRARLALIIGLLAIGVLLAGCGTSGASQQPSGTPDGSAAALGDLMRPANCSVTLFQTPTGATLDLTGRWAVIAAGDPVPTPAPYTDGTGIAIRQSGDCVWAVDQFYEGSGANFRRRVYLWYGRLTTDLEIHGVFLFLSNDDPTSLSNADLSIRVGFGADGEPFLCDSHNAHCPDAIVAGDTIEVRVADAE